MKISVSTLNFEKEMAQQKMTLWDVVYRIKELGFDTIELKADHFDSIQTEYLRDFAQRLQEHGLKICALSARNKNFGKKWADYKKDILMIMNCIHMANALNCPLVEIFIGGFDLEEQREDQRLRDYNALKLIILAAEREKIQIGIENHRIYFKKGELDNEDEAGDIISLINKINSPYLCAVPDSDNFFKPEFPNLSNKQKHKTYEEFARLLSYANHVHIKIKDFDVFGCSLRGHINKLCQIIKKAHYTKDITLEIMDALNLTLYDRESILVESKKMITSALE